MNEILDQFTENLKRTQELGALANALTASTHSIIDVSDILRAQIVLTVSALDHFIHELVRAGMIEVAKGIRPKTDAYKRFQISLDVVESALTGQPLDSWLGESVRKSHSSQSFQAPDKLADAVRLISEAKLWQEIANHLSLNEKDVKIKFKLIVQRRNKIAHEADLIPHSNPPSRWDIVASDVTETIEFIKKLGLAIFDVVANTNVVIK